MAFSLILDAWMPVRRRSGAAQLIRPAGLTDAIATDPIVTLDWPRADFRLAGLEFLIGLLATACPPASDDGLDEPGDWQGWYQSPPSSETLAAAFAPLAPAFLLDGDGPRFMQDFENFPGDANRLETLLIDAPGGQTLKKNADHFVKRGGVETMSRGMAAMALITLQAFAPAGGAGNRVGLRGGGPLTTLAIPPWPEGPVPLWHLLWANVPVGRAVTEAEWLKVFPWMGPTRTSEAKRITTPDDTHELHAFWGMARRIRLEFADNTGRVPCDLGGGIDPLVVTGWRQRPYGNNYAKWTHPLTPYYRQKVTDTEWLPVHPQPGGIGYRHWVGLLFDDATDKPLRQAAASIQRFRVYRLNQVAVYGDRILWRMLAAGYDMDNMKPRGFVESEMPIVEPADLGRAGDFIDLLRQLIAGASEAASLLGRSVRRALFSDGAKVALDAGLLTTPRERFWEQTETRFLHHVASAAAAGADPVAIRVAWRADLAGIIRNLFAEAAPMDAMGADRRPDRIAAAARGLGMALNGYGKEGEAFFKALSLPPPVSENAKAKPGRKIA